MASYYRRFILGFANIARPLHRLCDKGAKFLWTEECNEAFENLKTALTTAPILAYPKPELQFILDTDASNYAVGAALSQLEDGKERVIAYMSKSLNRHEISYCVTRKELLAVVKALKTFHSYLYGQHVLLRTDNAAVSWMRSLKCPSGQVARWLQELGTYDLEVTHRPGAQHRNADALSRNPCKSCQNQENRNVHGEQAENDDCEEGPFIGRIAAVTTRSQPSDDQSQSQDDTPVKLEIIRGNQVEDPDIEPILSAMTDNKIRPTWESVSAGTKSLKTLWTQWDRLGVRDGLLYRTYERDEASGELLQLVVPEKNRHEILQYCHNIPSSGHLGVEKTLYKVQQNFYWPGIKDSVKRYLEACDKCAAKKQTRKGKAPLQQYLVGEPFERIELDIFGPLPKTPSGNKYVLTMCDCFTKWTEAIPLPDQEATTVTRAFVNNFIARFGVPLQLHTDRGINFESTIFSGMCDLLKIDKTRTTSMRPESNGNIERFHRTLASMITMYCENNQHTWDEFLPQLLMAYRSSVHSSTGQTPNRMTLGREITMQKLWWGDRLTVRKTSMLQHTSPHWPINYNKHIIWQGSV